MRCWGYYEVHEDDLQGLLLICKLLKHLKENPDDKIARWYLFNCEHNLNLTGEQEVSYGLFENKIYEQQYQQK